MRPAHQITPRSCPWRHNLAEEGAVPRSSCRLVAEIAGVEDLSLAAVRLDECVACCGQVPPAPAAPNGMTASILLNMLEGIIKNGGASGCTAGQAAELVPFAEQHLLSFSPGFFQSKAPPLRRTPCRSLGPMTGERLCADCTGRVRIKVFNCTHPAHGETTMKECAGCPDYEPVLKAGGAVSRWAVGVTTAPRKSATLRRTLKSLRQSGWTTDTIFVFAEAGSARLLATVGMGPLKIIRRAPPATGAWPSFLLALSELYLRDPHADAYLMLQDDVDLVQGLKEYLVENLWPAQECGVVSLHTPRHLTSEGGAGFYKAQLGWSTWGAQGFVFPNASVRAILSDRKVIEHRMRGIGDGMKNVDSVIGDWCLRSGQPFWLHSPSLAEHTGLHSTLWQVSSLEGRRSAGDFPGTTTDIRALMPTLLKAADGRAPDPIIILKDGSVVKADDTPDLDPAAASHALDWSRTKLDIIALVVYRPWVWDDWCQWLLTCELPADCSLLLMDNAPPGEAEPGRKIRAFAARCLESGRFRTVALTRGTGPCGERGSERRDQGIGESISELLHNTSGDFAFLLDDDILPTQDALPQLHRTWAQLASSGARPGLITGAYISANHPDLLVAGFGENRWERSAPAGTTSPDPMRIDYGGTGCLFGDSLILRAHLPILASHSEGWRMGPDAWLCRQLRRAGYSIWLDTAVPCEHRYEPPA